MRQFNFHVIISVGIKNIAITDNFHEAVYIARITRVLFDKGI